MSARIETTLFTAQSSSRILKYKLCNNHTNMRKHIHLSSNSKVRSTGETYRKQMDRAFTVIFHNIQRIKEENEERATKAETKRGRFNSFSTTGYTAPLESYKGKQFEEERHLETGREKRGRSWSEPPLPTTSCLKTHNCPSFNKEPKCFGNQSVMREMGSLDTGPTKRYLIGDRKQRRVSFCV